MPDLVNQITAKSTDFSSKEALVHELMTNPLSFHHVTKSHMSFNGAYQEPEKFLPFAARYITNMKNQAMLIKEETACFYIYEQVSHTGKSCTGIIGLCTVNDYLENKIKKHEEIRPSRLKFLIELFKTVHVMGEPTLLAHNGVVRLDQVKSTEIYRFTSVDHKLHIIKKVDNPQDIAAIQDDMAAIENFYIADGHHRSASSAEFSQLVPGPHNNKSMCFILHEDQLEIHPFHRLIKPHIAIDSEKLLADLSATFKIVKSDLPLYTIENTKDFGLYIDKQWYLISYLEKNDVLDVEILEEVIVKGVFNIHDSRTDSQISFHPYTSGIDEMLNLVDSGTFSVAITTKPCSFENVRAIADKGSTLPPKSTYIEPKLRAGLIIQEFLE